MTKSGLGPAGYKGLLTQYVSELIEARGGGADVQELVGQLLYRHGFSGLFTSDDKIDTEAVRAGLCELLPPAPIDPEQEKVERLAAAKADNYGCGPGEEGLARFNSLPPEKRLALIAESERVEPPTVSASNWYGMKTEAAFMALEPSERLRLAHAADTPQRRPTTQIAMPADAHEWRPQDRITYASCPTAEERDKVASDARGYVKADKANREETERQNAGLNA